MSEKSSFHHLSSKIIYYKYIDFERKYKQSFLLLFCTEEIVPNINKVQHYTYKAGSISWAHEMNNDMYLYIDWSKHRIWNRFCDMVNSITSKINEKRLVSIRFHTAQRALVTY